MLKMTIPEGARLILSLLEQSGEKAYLVGGCVRDALLGKEPHDWDIATSAGPEKMLEVFRNYRVIETGIKHGTVTVLQNGEPYEVTAFRVDGTYSDHRRPDFVTFVTNVEDDLARRDFTVNAMAFSPREGLVDPFGGEKDLQSGIIRCVGDPDLRFQEDGLRILRALRFSSVYGFPIEEKTAEAAERNAFLLKEIAAERIYAEFGKLLHGKARTEVLLHFSKIITVLLPELAACVGFDQKNPFHRYPVYEHIIRAVGEYRGEDPVVLWALLLHDAGKPESFFEDEKGGHFYGHAKISFTKAQEAFSRLKADKATSDAACELILHHDAVFEPTEKCLKHWMNRIGPEQLMRLLQVHEADIRAQSEAHLRERVDECALLRSITDTILAESQCFSLKDLAINGNDLKAIGVAPGKEIGLLLHSLLEKVIAGELPNEREALLDQIKTSS